MRIGAECYHTLKSIIKKKCFHPLIYLTVAAICIGPIMVAYDSPWEAKTSEAGSQVFGAIMMVAAMIGGACTEDSTVSPKMRAGCSGSSRARCSCHSSHDAFCDQRELRAGEPHAEMPLAEGTV